MVYLFVILTIHSSCAPLQVLLDSTEQTFYLSHNKTPLKRLINPFIVFMLYDTNVGPFLGIQAYLGRKMKKEPLFLTCIKKSCPFVIVMKYQTDKVSFEIVIVNLSANLSC